MRLATDRRKGKMRLRTPQTSRTTSMTVKKRETRSNEELYNREPGVGQRKRKRHEDSQVLRTLESAPKAERRLTQKVW